MKRILLLLTIPFGLVPICGQVGLGTTTVQSSAMLEMNVDNLPSNQKKGFLGPRLELQSNTDVTTVPTPAVGLIVFNTTTNGTYPNNVIANKYYFWNGTKWSEMAITSIVEAAVVPRIYYGSTSNIQSFDYVQMNNAVKQLVTFPNMSVFNQGDIVTYDATNSTFTASVSGLYEISSFINYNPNNNKTLTGQYGRSFLNYIIEVQRTGTATWEQLVGTRTAWGDKAATYFKTVNIPPVPVTLQKNDKVRFLVVNPFTDGSGNYHATAGDAQIGTTTNLPVSKSVKFHLLDYNL